MNTKHNILCVCLATSGRIWYTDDMNENNKNQRKKRTTKYGTVYNDLLAKIKSGALKVGDKLPTESELTVLYGVSRITVSRALKELADINLVYRVKKAGTFVNGKLNHKNMQLIIPVILAYYDEADEIMSGMESVTLSHNIFLPRFNSKNNVVRERKILRELLDGNNVDGLIAYPCTSRENVDIYAEFLLRGIPVVCIDRFIEGIDTPLVTTDNARCMERIVDELARRGHERIAFFSLSDKMAITETERFKGYCSGLIQNGLPLRREYLFESTDINRRETRLSQTRQLALRRTFAATCLDGCAAMAEPPTAICCMNDTGMRLLYECATQRGIRVPRDLMLTGFDCLDENEIRTRGLMGVRQNFYGLGKAAIELILTILDGKAYRPLERIGGITVLP